MGFDEPHLPTQAEANAGNMRMLDDIIDIIADRYIQHDMGGIPYDGGTNHHLYINDDTPWEWVTSKPVDGYGGSPAEAKAFYIQTGKAVDNGDDSWTIETLSGGHPSYDVWVKKGGAKWREVRSWFEGIKKPYETAFSFKQSAFVAPRISLEFAVDDLIPAGQITDADVGELSAVDVLNTDDSPTYSSNLQQRLLGNDSWSDARTADRFLEGWQGRGAQVFKWSFLERLPSVLVGQATTAKALQQSVDILERSYTNVRVESIGRMFDAESIFELYPYHDVPPSDPAGWADIIKGIGGVAEDIGTVAGWIPHPAAQAVGKAAGGVATVAKILTEPLPLIGVTIIQSPEHQEIEQKPLAIEGSTVNELYENWYSQITAFINTVLNAEKIIGENLGEFTQFINETKSSDGAQLETTFGDTVQLTMYHSFFCAPAPGSGAFTLNTNSGLGPSTPNGDRGTAFSGDLNELFKVAMTHLPATAWTFGTQSDMDDTSSMAADTTRTIYESSPYSGGDSYATSSNGAALQPWMDLYAEYDTMMQDSKTNLTSAAAALKAAAIQYGQTDAEAAANLDKKFQDAIAAG
ncbi:hypothetical protein [Stackebrandtia soli]|uniref:hypothetical protein n=1 Tax=Stackebrandtia soli TaxID=1892856 RepID=UPI0039E80CEA